MLGGLYGLVLRVCLWWYHPGLRRLHVLLSHGHSGMLLLRPVTGLTSTRALSGHDGASTIELVLSHHLTVHCSNEAWTLHHHPILSGNHATIWETSHMRLVDLAGHVGLTAVHEAHVVPRRAALLQGGHGGVVHRRVSQVLLHILRGSSPHWVAWLRRRTGSIIWRRDSIEYGVAHIIILGLLHTFPIFLFKPHQLSLIVLQSLVRCAVIFVGLRVRYSIHLLSIRKLVRDHGRTMSPRADLMIRLLHQMMSLLHDELLLGNLSERHARITGTMLGLPVVAEDSIPFRPDSCVVIEDSTDRGSILVA